MKVNQIYNLINDVTKEVLGETALINEDLSNVVDIGKEIINTDNLDNYVRKLVNHIGKVIFVDRIYSGGVPSVILDSWEFGSILEKISSDLPKASENESWKLENGKDYSSDIFYQPSVNAKFFNSRVTFEIPLSFTEKQVKESFSSIDQLNGFYSMLSTSIENSMTIKLDALIMRTINNMIGETVFNELNSSGKIDTSKTTAKCVNLLTLYNSKYEKISYDKALTNVEFIRFATYIIGLYYDRMSKISTIFNVGKKERFTPNDMNVTVLLSDFTKASDTFLISNTFNTDKVNLPNHDTIPYWQGSGLEYNFDDVSRINVKTSSGNAIDIKGIIGVMFDKYALGVCNLDRRVTTNYNPKAEFFTNFYKFDAGYYNDLNENFVVFYIGEAEETKPGSDENLYENVAASGKNNKNVATPGKDNKNNI